MSSHIDPGDPPRSRYPDDLNCHNPDPINAWQPGSVAAQREGHFRPEGGSSLGDRSPHAQKAHVTQAEMGPVPVVYAQDYIPEARLEKDGPNYGSLDHEPDIPTLQIRVGIPTRERTMRILRGPATGALLEFMRMQQSYRDTDEALGAQGQFAEIFHDTAKLKRMIWDRSNPQSVAVGEVQETLMSLIGHALLAMDNMDEGNKDGRTTGR